MKFNKSELIMALVALGMGFFLLPLLIINLIAFIFFLYIDIYIHELGHYFFGRIMNIGVSRVIVGKGKEIWRKKIFGTLFIINKGIGGANAIGKITLEFIRTRMFIFTIGGVFMQMSMVILCILLFGLDLHFSHTINIPGVFACSNILLIVFNLIPYQTQIQGFKRPNDGLLLLKIPKLNEKDINELLSAGDIMEAHEFYEKRDYLPAMEAFQRCIEKFPASEVAKADYALCLMECLRFEESKSILLNILQQKYDPKYEASIYNNLTWLYLLNMKQESLLEADKFSKKIMDLNPNHTNFRNTRGCVLIELGEIAEGIVMLEGQTDLNKSIDEKTNNPTGFIYLAYGYFLKGDQKTADKYLKHLDSYLSKLNPADAYLFEKLKQRTHNFSLDTASS